MLQNKQVIAGVGLKEFFREQILQAIENIGIKIDEMLEYYLVNLLCDFSHCGVSSFHANEPLALIYKRALESKLAERLRLLKGLGDVSLYTAGFFEERVRNSAVNVQYYADMGGKAFSALSDVLRESPPASDVMPSLYAELSLHFTELVDVLNEVADECHLGGNARNENILRIYKRWAKNGSAKDYQRLLDSGLTPPFWIPTEFE